MSRIYKAKPSEVADYDGVYPLYGWVKVDGHKCAVEDLRKSWGEDDPKFEIIAP